LEGTTADRFPNTKKKEKRVHVKGLTLVKRRGG